VGADAQTDIYCSSSAGVCQSTNAALFGFLIIFFVLPLALPVVYGLVGPGNAWRRNRDARRLDWATPPSAG
jgi:hypothetical protein